MNGRVFSLCLACVVSAPPAFANPPAAVEVVDEGDDLFSRSTETEDAVRKRADDLFEALEKEEAKRAKAPVPGPASGGDIADVEVLGDDGADWLAPPPAAPAVPAVPAAPGAAPTPPATPATPVAPPPTVGSAPPPPPPAASARAEAPRSWWDRPSHVSAGDLVLWVHGGSFDGGGFGGFGGEGMASDTIGIRLSGSFGSFGHAPPGSGFSKNFNVFEGGLWAIPRDVNPDTARGGYVHLTELSVTAHLFDKSMFDPYATFGLAHLGYEVDFRDGTERGGAAYTRLGGGANLHFSRFFAGLDFGWYPVELFRYSVNEKTRDGYEGQFEEVTNRFESERFTLTAQVGLRF